MTKRLCFLLFCYTFAVNKNDRPVINMEEEQTEEFEMLRKTYTYEPATIFTNQLSNLAFGIGMVVVPMICPFGLRIRRAYILSPAVFSTILITGGVLLLLFTYFSMRKALALKKQGGTITVDNGRVTYPEVRKGKIEYDTFHVSDIEYIKDDEKENQCKINLPDKYVIFETKYFDSFDEYDEFRALLEKKHNNQNTIKP